MNNVLIDDRRIKVLTAIMHAYLGVMYKSCIACGGLEKAQCAD